MGRYSFCLIQRKKIGKFRSPCDAAHQHKNAVKVLVTKSNVKSKATFKDINKIGVAV